MTLQATQSRALIGLLGIGAAIILATKIGAAIILATKIGASIILATKIGGEITQTYQTLAEALAVVNERNHP